MTGPLLLDLPDCRASDDADEVTITARMLTQDVLEHRIGERVSFDGVRGFKGDYIVTAVEFKPGDPTGTVTVATPVDPTPRPAAPPPGAETVGLNLGGLTPGLVLPSGGGTLSPADCARVAHAVGLRGEQIVLAVAIAMGESRLNPRAHNPRGADNSYGLWQINMLGGMGPSRRRALGIGSNEALWDPFTNARAMHMISGGGRNWRPWTVYTRGIYRQYMGAARGGAAAAGVI